MGEIKSTLEMVLARAERLSAHAPDEQDFSESENQGRRSAAAFLRGDSILLAELIRNQDAQSRSFFLRGLLDTFLRQLLLPRTTQPPEPDGAIRGLLESARAIDRFPVGKLESLLMEMKGLLAQFTDHKTKLRTQLEERFSMQMAHLEQSLARQTGMHMKMSPAQHPKFQEQWSQVLADLQTQYDGALDQYRGGIRQLFGIS